MPPIQIQVTKAQLDEICALLVGEIQRKMLHPSETLEVGPMVTVWRAHRSAFVEEYIKRWPRSRREEVEELGRHLDGTADLLEMLVEKGGRSA